MKCGLFMVELIEIVRVIYRDVSYKKFCMAIKV